MIKTKDLEIPSVEQYRSTIGTYILQEQTVVISVSVNELKTQNHMDGPKAEHVKREN